MIPIVENVIKTDPPYCRSLYEIERKTIIQYICEKIMAVEAERYIFIINRSDYEKYHLDKVIKLIIPQAVTIIAHGPTRGSACSCLLAMDYFNAEEELVIMGGDQFVICDLQAVVDSFREENLDGGVITFKDIHPRWSYVKIDSNGYIVEAAEKRPISNCATTGFYYFRKTSDFVESAFSMISKDASVDGKYYVCPVYNEMVLQQKKIRGYKINKENYFNFNHMKGIELFEQYCRKEAENAGKQD